MLRSNNASNSSKFQQQQQQQQQQQTLPTPPSSSQLQMASRRLNNAPNSAAVGTGGVGGVVSRKKRGKSPTPLHSSFYGLNKSNKNSNTLSFRIFSTSRMIRYLSWCALGCVLLVSFIILARIHALFFTPAHYVESVNHGGVTEVRDKRQPKSPWPRTLGWNDRLTSIKCRKTKFQPYSVGCPHRCDSQRTDLSATEQPLYRTEVYWDFGNLDDAVRNLYTEIENGLADEFELSDKFPRASYSLVRNFLKLERDVIRSMPANVHLTKRGKIYLTLFYFCCLTESEVQKVRESLKSWMESREFHFPLLFDRVECWQTKHDSISTILIASDSSQRLLFSGIYEDAMKAFTRDGISIPVKREDQIPFHAPLVAVSAMDGSESFSRLMGGIAGASNRRLTSAADTSRGVKNHGTSTMPPFGTNITFEPTISTKMTCHVNCH